MNRNHSSRRQTIRLLTQAAALAIQNGYIRGFAEGKIYTGALKQLCVPGLNCYSCPGALASCPIGSLQATLNSRQFQAACYVTGLLVMYGALLGRLICGFLCPFGLVQDLLFKIPFVRKLRSLPGEQGLRWIRFGLLLVFVILLPMLVMDFTGLGEPWFCKWICPAGTLEGGVILVLLDQSLRSVLGFLYAWKVSILIAVVLLSLVISRPFCRYLCPLGAVYGLLNRFALYRYAVDPAKCIHCKASQRACQMDIPVWEKPNSMDCIRCGACLDACPTGALSVMGLKNKAGEGIRADR